MTQDDNHAAHARRPRVTIKDVARKAGVSVTTASVVLNGRPTAIPVGEETRQRVLAAGTELDYRPNPFARSLRTGRSHTLGLMVTTIADPFTGEVVQATDAVARERGYRTLLMLSGMGLSTEGQPAPGEAPGLRFVDGALLLGFQLRGHAPFPGVAARHRGLVTAIPNNPDLPSFAVDVDVRAGVQFALRHLHDLGHRRIAMIYDPRHLRMRDRRAAFEDFLQDANLPATPGAVAAAEATYYEGGTVATAALLANPSPPTAILAANDQLAIGALHAVWRRGLRVPQDCSVVGFDDLPVAQYLAPALTTVRQPIAEMGRTAIETLIDLLESKRPPSPRADLLLQPELVIRDSTAPPAS
jgi:DNA-binding LacI/PurR family transcriptional regulator